MSTATCDAPARVRPSHQLVLDVLLARTTGREPCAVRAVFLPLQQARLVA